MIDLKFKRVHPSAVIPKYQSDGAACADLHAVFEGPFDYTYVHPGQTEVIQTGLVGQVPVGYELQIRSRSGMATQGVIVANGVGCIDSDYRGVIGVILHNCSPNVVKITQGDRIAQCCLSAVPRINFVEVDEVDETDRGDGAYGSTGNR